MTVQQLRTLNLGGSMLVVDDAGLVPAENAQPVICFMFDGETLTSLKLIPTLAPPSQTLSWMWNHSHMMTHPTTLSM